MSRRHGGFHNSAHTYNGRNYSRGERKNSKLGQRIDLDRLTELLAGERKESEMSTPKDKNGAAPAPAVPTEGVTVIALYAEQVKRLNVVDIRPPATGAVKIGGRNEQGKCIPEGSLVALWDGSRKPIETVREADLLVGLHPDSWLFQPEHPLRMMTSAIQPVYELRTTTGHRVQATAQHRLLTPSGWTELHKLVVGQHLAVPMRLPSAEAATAGLTDEAAELIGLLLGDGSLTEGLGFTNSDPGVIAAFERCFAAVLPRSVLRVSSPRGRAHIKQFLASKGRKTGRLKGEHGEWLDRLGLRGHGAATKFIPEAIFQSGRHAVLACLAGLLSTDGWMMTDGRTEYYTVSPTLASGARALFLRLGIPTTWTTWATRTRDCHRITVVTGPGRERCREMLLPRVARTHIKTPERAMHRPGRAFSLPPEVIESIARLGCKGLSAWTRGHSRMSRDRFMRALATVDREALPAEITRFGSLDVGWDRIASITPVGPRQTFDLQMPSEAFVVSDFIVHNSSALDAIMMTLGGKGIGAELVIHKGAKHAKAVVEFGEFTATRTWTDDAHSYVTVYRRGDKKPLARPQEFLDALCGQGLGFDPQAFARQTAKQQVASMLGLLQLPEDPRELDAQSKAAYTERTAVNRDVLALRSRVESLPAPDPKTLTHEEVSIESLTQEQARRLEAKSANERMRSRAGEAGRAVETARAEVGRLREALAAAEARFTSADQERAQAEDAAAALLDPDLTAIVNQIANIELTNAQIRRAREWQAAHEELRVTERTASELTDGLTRIEERKRDLLAAAPFPVPGLGFEEVGGEYQVTYQGVPLKDAGASVQLRIGMAVAMAANPALKVVLLRDASLLDAQTRQIVIDLATASGYQVWLELVGEGDGDAFVIEDGSVARLPEGMTAPAGLPAAAVEW